MYSVTDFQIPADDKERAKKFYSSVFGWKTNDVPGVDYTGLITAETDENSNRPKRPGAINGGMMKREGTFKNPTITITVDDIDKALENVEKGGGKIVKGKDSVMDMGFVAWFQDTEGNVLALWQYMKK
ncbi:MAG: VOC family protein [Candidatus Micrarchaeota archaeon]|nr:VOC family protein [Candidatus Micrarchaeota archaeon]